MSYSGDDVKNMVKALSLVTGWDYTDEEAVRMSLRVTNLARVFNLKTGIVPDLEVPSERYGSTPEDGPVKGVGIMTHWQEMVDEYYKMMGWDRLTGKPLPETLEKLGLSSVIADIW
jgi:aldehyde:ferredoxin oxidoreductase